MGEGLWPVFWAAVALLISGMAAWGSTMMMRLIDDRIEVAKREILAELDGVEGRLADLESRLLAPPEAPRLPESSDEMTAQG